LVDESHRSISAGSEILVQDREQLDSLEYLANWFRGLNAAGGPSILEEPRGGENSVDDLCAALGMMQLHTANLLAYLRWCRCVASRRERRRIDYELEHSNSNAILDVAYVPMAPNGGSANHPTSVDRPEECVSRRASTGRLRILTRTSSCSQGIA